ncbi:MAG: SufD family Fe-S cluster assembly protein [Candidatus Neomarinimicrobiota bacterium]
MNLSDYQNQFDKLISRKEKSTKFQNFRNSYFSEFLKVGLPTQKWEDWRFTNLSQLKKEKFDISEVHSNSLKRVDLLKYDIEGVITFVFVNGQYQERNQVFPKGLKVSTGLKDFEPHRINVPPKMSDPFELLNTAFVDSAISITIKENIDFKSPIRFLYLSENKTNLMISPKIYLKVSNSSSGTFIEEHFSRKGSLFHNQSTNVKLEKNSTLNHIRIQSNSLKTTTINNITINQKKDSSYNFTQFSEGSGLSRSNINSYLDEEGSQCYINGLSLSKNSQQIDNNIIITHNAPKLH